MSLFCLLVILITLLVSVAFLTLLERKVLSLVGYRVGPNKVSFVGVLQPLGDAFKLSNKSVNMLSSFSVWFYGTSSFLMLAMSILLISCIYVYPSLVSLKFSLLVLFCVLGFNSLNAILCGWCAFSKYPLLGSVRNLCQLISYEGSLYLCLFFVIFLLFGFDLGLMSFFSFPLLCILMIPCFYIWIPSFLAELNRTPYDFAEGESELVSGFNTEFGSCGFTLIFLAEYSNIIFFCILGSSLFFSSNPLFPLISAYSVIWFRSVLPRYRFDKLMFLAWKFFIPFLTFFLLTFVMAMF